MPCTKGYMLLCRLTYLVVRKIIQISISALRWKDLLTAKLDKDQNPDIYADGHNLVILLVLYILQGIPIGLTAAIPLLLQRRGTNHGHSPMDFSLATWPLSLRVLWAPMVDTLYVRHLGRRKSWLVPVQCLLGALMMILSRHLYLWLGGYGLEPNVPLLTVVFLLLNFLAATQDLVVEAWALTMLKRCNVGYAATCHSVGQTLGYFLGYVVVPALEYKDFCNKYLQPQPVVDMGWVTLPRYLWLWGITFVVASSLVALFKREEDPPKHELNLSESYSNLWHMVHMPPLQILAALLVSVRIMFATADALTGLKLIEAGVPREELAPLTLPLMPLQLLLPLVLGRHTNGPRPMAIYLKAIPWRLAMATVASILTYAAPYLIQDDRTVPTYYYILLGLNYVCYQVFLYTMFVAAMAFFAQISDPALGGTYMAFLSTLYNLGGTWPNTVALWLVEGLTWQSCPAWDEGKCEATLDGYYMDCGFCVVYGMVWLLLVRQWVVYLQDLPKQCWLVVKQKDKQKKDK